MIPLILTLTAILTIATWGLYDVITNPADWCEPMPEGY